MMPTVEIPYDGGLGEAKVLGVVKRAAIGGQEEAIPYNWSLEVAIKLNPDTVGAICGGDLDGLCPAPE